MRLLVGIALVAAASSARADATDDEIARAHFQTGLSYYNSDRFGPAINEFLEAHRLSRRPKLLYNVAKAYERLGDAGRASTFYRRYLVDEPSPPEREEVQASLLRLAAQVGRVTVRAHLAGSEVILDGESAGTTPLVPLEVTQGKHHLELRRPGYLPAQLDMEVRGGQSAEVVLDPTAAGAATMGRSTAADATASGRLDLAVRRRPRWLWPVVGVAAAVVVAVVAVVLAVTLSGTNYGDVARRSCTSPDCVVWPP